MIRRFILYALAVAALLLPVTLLADSPPACPDDGCCMYYTGKDDWCVGIRCRHVKYYKCGCCGKLWGVYQ
jgi:hypothetical protein